ncbi:hypothetical protein PHYPSEUDO_002347 [Phytophthora pseudosyringae]|uniref:Uncharacterized protein n=1 Tax=Phytophthora pseudosyringae TaxID=221518 RepID=A0A8T1WJN3_9STRA|nr:hypothetical protein PHYPSEUDO_002347 [Phytophthora pseudosyringae]
MVATPMLSEINCVPSVGLEEGQYGENAVLEEGRETDADEEQYVGTRANPKEIGREHFESEHCDEAVNGEAVTILMFMVLVRTQLSSISSSRSSSSLLSVKCNEDKLSSSTSTE